MRTLDKVKYTKGNKDLQSVNSEQDIELKVTNGELQFSTDGTNFNDIVSYEVASINLDTAEDGLYLLKATSPSITYGNTTTSAEELNGAIVQRAFESGFGTSVQVIKTNGEIERYFKSYISGATWNVKTYITTPVTTITNNSTDYEVPSAKCVYDNFTQKGVPSGGTQGQVLTKNSSTDYDTVWANASGGKLYMHIIKTSYNYKFILYTKNSNAFTSNTLKNFFNTNDFTSAAKGFPIYPKCGNIDSKTKIFTNVIFLQNNNFYIYVDKLTFEIVNNDIQVSSSTQSISDTFSSDTVIEV